MWLREDDHQENLKNTPMREGTIKAPLQTETVQEEQIGAPVKEVPVNLAPDPTAREAIIKVEMVHKTEAEEAPNHQLTGEASPKNSSA